MNQSNLTEERRGKGQKLVTRYSYDCEHRLTSITKPDGSTWHYEYDAFGRRIAKTNGLTRTEFLWQGDRLIAEETGDQYRTYIYEPDTFKPLALVEGYGKENATPYYYHLDHLGTPQELTNQQGKLVWSVTYRAYGNVVQQQVAEIDNPLRFQGQYHDVETGLHYNRHRYYNPNTGRFITPDPIGLAGGLNNYQYVPNPTGWVDPLGLAVEKGSCPTPLEMTSAERRALIEAKSEANAERWVRNFEANLNSSFPELNAHFVDKHGPDIPLQPNLEQRAITGAHPRTGAVRGRRSRPQVSSQFENWRTQMHALNEALTREARGLSRYNAVDAKGNPAVVGSSDGFSGHSFRPNKRDPSAPHFEKLSNWVIRFDPGSNMPFTGYPTR